MNKTDSEFGGRTMRDMLSSLSISLAKTKPPTNNLTLYFQMPPHNVEDAEHEMGIESVGLPANGIQTSNTGVTTFAFNVQMCEGEYWVLNKRYSEIRALHKHLKSIGAPVENLSFPPKFLRRNPSSTSLEKRRQALEKYFCALLQIRPFLRCELFNFLSVNKNVEDFRRMEQKQRCSHSDVEAKNDVLTLAADDMLTQHNEDEVFESIQQTLTIDIEMDTDSIEPAHDEMQNNEERDSASSDGTPSDHGAHTFIYEEIRLEDLIEKCEHMDELQTMSENVVDRLLRIRNQLYEMDPHTISPDVRTSFASICQRVRAFLEQHADRKTVERIASVRTLTSDLFKFNLDLNSFHILGHEDINRMGTWNEMTRDVGNTLEINAGQLGAELSDTMAQRNKLVLLANETKQSVLENGAVQDLASELLQVTVETVERMSDGAIEDVPDRFIAEFEIQRDAEPFSSGSSGKVYRGIWRGAKVVIKYVEVTTHEEMRSFLHEGKIWHMARHPNVVTYFGACHLPRPCFLVSEEAVNGSSVNYIAREKVRGRSVIWRLMHEAALGLRFLHDSKIIHGDLACRNILVDTNGSAKLVDFGMSFLKDSSPTVYVGPIRWTAPECVLRNQTPSFQSDLYSIGMCIIEAAIGRDPWGNLSDIEVHYKLAHQEFLAQPAELNDDQWRLVTSLCAFDPNQRCSLDDAIDQLTAFALEEATTYTTRPQRNHRRTSI